LGLGWQAPVRLRQAKMAARLERVVVMGVILY
jgi:hypothetical protein